ncbi:MAG: TMEM198/TM7SF3 family protein [Clostridia bacterium]|nr:TMEM198/TM7SF3 family protein [Clostridia bacterium]NLS85216.1 TMEM198/TM7SF3 family protein [Oscillospiraceae bacterium]
MEVEAFLQNATIASIIAIVISLLACFFGYKLEKLFIGIASAIAGGTIGYILASAIPNAPQWAYIALVAVGAIIFLGLSFKLYLAGIFVLCFVFVALAANAYIKDATLMWIVLIVGGLIAGILGVKLTRPVLIVTSALSGGATVFSEAFKLIGSQELSAVLGGYLPLLLAVVLAALGAWFQFKTTKK